MKNAPTVREHFTNQNIPLIQKLFRNG